MSSNEVGQRLVDLCKSGRFQEALDLYSPDAVSVEAMANETMPAVMRGIEAIRRKGESWLANNEVHSTDAKGPYPNGDRFAVIFDVDVTPKAGPMAGRRMQMEEVGLYTVENGKIVREEFFYRTA